MTAIRLACLLLLAASSQARDIFPFRLARPAEVVAELDMRSPGADWGAAGREASVAEISLDGAAPHHVMLFAGETTHTYAVFLGLLPAGEHRLIVDRQERFSAPETGLEVAGIRFREHRAGDPDFAALSRAPVLFARPDTVGRFSDVPLLVYCERLEDGGAPLLQYTIVFSNEDGGTSTRALMARWGRATDIEYIYRAWLDPGGGLRRATIQAKGHEEVGFQGRYFGSHPLLMPVTDNNMVSGEGSSAIRYQLAPVIVDLEERSREAVMDEHSVTYRVMAQELAREGKLRPFGGVEGQNIGDPRNYLYLEAKLANRNARLAAAVRLRGESRWRHSHLGRFDYAIERDGWVRTTIELPTGADPSAIAEIGFQCLAGPPAVAGVCRLHAVRKAFLLDRHHRPGPSFWSLEPSLPGWEIPSGEMLTFQVGRGN